MRWHSARTAGFIAVIGAVVLLLGVLNVLGVIGWYRSNTTISSTEKAQIANYYLAHERFYDHHARAGCPVDVLGADRHENLTTAYTVVHCWTSGPRCQPLSDETSGVVAHLIDGNVRSEQFDDADDYAGSKSELSIYPRLLRGKAFDLIDSDGPSGYDKKAMLMAGCPTN